MLTRNGRLNPRKEFDWEDALIDSLIMAALTFFTSLGGMSVVGVPEYQGFVASGIASGTQFFLVLAMKRGLVKK